MSAGDYAMHRLPCQVEAESAKGLRISYDGRHVWLPKSQIEIVKEGINVPAWLLEAKGIQVFAPVWNGNTGDEWSAVGEDPPVDLGDPSDWAGDPR